MFLSSSCLLWFYPGVLVFIPDLSTQGNSVIHVNACVYICSVVVWQTVPQKKKRGRDRKIIVLICLTELVIGLPTFLFFNLENVQTSCY